MVVGVRARLYDQFEVWVFFGQVVGVAVCEDVEWVGDQGYVVVGGLGGYNAAFDVGGVWEVDETVRFGP